MLMGGFASEEIPPSPKPMEKVIDVGKEFSRRLVYATGVSGCGPNNGVAFRQTFLKEFDSPAFWVNPPKDRVVFDFQNVDLIGPGFAANAFAYFRQYAPKDVILDTFKFNNIRKVHRAIIEEELDAEW